MTGREYLVRQTKTLLTMAKTIKDPTVSGKLVAKAADLKERLDDGNPENSLDVGEHCVPEKGGSH